MQRLARFDPTGLFGKSPSRLAAQIIFGICCGAAMIVLRFLIDQFAPNIGPFALIYPAVLLATLYGHWQAGIAATIMSFVWAWWYVLPIGGSFELAFAEDGWRVAINAITALIVLVFAEAFRRAVREATEQRDREIEHVRDLFAELEHRTKNNFQLITSLLEMQKKREAEPAAKLALTVASGRVRSFAEAYTKMPIPTSKGHRVSIRPYLTEIVDHVSKAVFHDQVTVDTRIDDLTLPREHAVAIGLYTNEALTNCAKHAFGGGRKGIVKVDFVVETEGWELTIEDDGAGLKQTVATRRGTGSSLMDAFAKQARGVHTMAGNPSGCKVRLRSNGLDREIAPAAA